MFLVLEKYAVFNKKGIQDYFFKRGRERKKICLMFHISRTQCTQPQLSKGMVEYLVAPASSRITHPHPAFFHCTSPLYYCQSSENPLLVELCEVLVDGAIKGATRGRKNGRSKYKIIVGFQFQWNRDHTLTRNTHTHQKKWMKKDR